MDCHSRHVRRIDRDVGHLEIVTAPNPVRSAWLGSQKLPERVGRLLGPFFHYPMPSALHDHNAHVRSDQFHLFAEHFSQGLFAANRQHRIVSLVWASCAKSLAVCGHATK
jgi:hypothetical protein